MDGLLTPRIPWVYTQKVEKLFTMRIALLV